MLEARHPTSRHGNLTDHQGHDLYLRLKAWGGFSAHLVAARQPASPSDGARWSTPIRSVYPECAACRLLSDPALQAALSERFEQARTGSHRLTAKTVPRSSCQHRSSARDNVLHDIEGAGRGHDGDHKGFVRKLDQVMVLAMKGHDPATETPGVVHTVQQSFTRAIRCDDQVLPAGLNGDVTA